MDNNNTSTNILFKCFAAVILLIITVCQAAYASSGDTIRVGYYTLENYHSENQNGNVVGYEVEYLNRVSNITGWNYEYIKLNSWSEALDALRNGDIDILSPAQFSQEKEQEFAYSSLPLGKAYGGIMTLSTNEFIYEDFEAFSNMTFGIEKDSMQDIAFRQYAQENGFLPKVVYYKDFASLVEALNVGDIDALVDNIMRTQKSMKLLGKFGASSFYFTMRKDDTEHLNELNNAMYEIDIADPALEQELISDYFPIYNVEILTKEEIEYISNMRELVIGCPSNLNPVSYIDEYTNEISGIARDILDKVAQNTGLKFKYKEIPAGSISYEDLRALNIDLIANVEYNSVNSNTPGIMLSSPYFRAQKVIVCDEDIDFNPESSMTLAIVSGSQTIKEVIKNKYPYFEVVPYMTVEESLDALKKGEVDAVMQNQYSVERLLQKPKYENLNVLASIGIGDAHSLSPMLYKDGTEKRSEELSNPLLMSVINKGINNISQDEMSLIIIKQTTKNRYKFTVSDFLYRYKYAVAIGTTALFIISISLNYILKIRKENIKILKNSEKRLENITNNINGGVLILQPDKELRLLYANEGFWNLLQYDKDEITDSDMNNYIMYVHDKDKETLNSLLEKPMEKDKYSVSLRLRVRRRNGQYIPALFNGTLATDENGMKKLYCVIMDISQEVAIQEKLKLEEQKHHLLINKTEQIVYEIEFAQNEIRTSEAFKKKFGWTLARSYKSLDEQEILSIWRINPKDQYIFIEAFNQCIKELKDINITVRMLKDNGKDVWCNISQFIMLDSKGNPKELLGLIRDVDRDMREKRKLTEKTQRDFLTGLYNKETFKQRSKEYLKNCGDEDCAVVFVDLDNFKNVNDKLGHIKGDNAIESAAEVLKTIFSSNDIVARFGGDEFCILVKNITNDALTLKIKLLLEKLCHTYTDDNNNLEVAISGSIGITTASVSGYELEKLLEHADTALYESKEAGRNCFTFYESKMTLD